MANALNVKIGGDIQELERALSQASRAIQDTGRRMTSMGKTLSARVTAPLVALGGVAVKQAGNFERLRTSMDILNGSVEEGARNFERLQQFSARTPFQLQDLASAQNMLQGFGQTADDAFHSLEMIGDIAAVTGGSIEGIGIAFGQAAAEGKVMTRDIRQFINQGVPMVKLLAETMGVAQSEIFDLASQGEISFEILQQAFRDATTEGGMFAGGMEKQSKTINGLFSTLKDNVALALGELGDSIVDALSLREVIPELIENIGRATEWFKSLSDDARRNILLITAAIAGIGPALIAVGVTVTALGVAIGALASPVVLVVGAIAGLVTAVVYLRENWEAVIERVSDIGWWRNAIIDMVQFLNKYSPISLMIDQFNNLLEFFGREGIPNPFDRINESLEGLKVETKEYEHQFGSLKDAILNTIEEFSGIDFRTMFTGVPVVTENVQRLGKGIERASLPVRQLGLTFQQVENSEISPAIQRIMDRLNRKAQMLEFVTGIANDFTNSFGQGMANVVVQGERVIDVLKNIGKLLASSVIQRGLSALLTGGLGGTGFFGAGGGLFGRLFNVNDALITSGGDVVKFHPDDNILAMKDFSGLGGGTQRVEVFGTLKGQDLWVSSNRGGETYGR